MRTLVSISLIFVLSACSPASLQIELENKLNRAGYFSMSDSNNYTAVNSVVEHYAQHSPELKGFLATEGVPDAVRYKKTVLGPRRFFFAYAQPPRLFTAMQIETGWMITGPDPLPPSVSITPIERSKKAVSKKKTATLPKATPSPSPSSKQSPQGSPTVVASARVSPTPSSSPVTQSSPTVSPTNPPPTPRATPTPVTPTPSASMVKNSSPSPSPAIGSKRMSSAHPMTTAQLSEVKKLIAELGKQPAKLSPKGDVTYVVLGEQPFAAISLWYAMDRSAEGLLRRINKIPTDQQMVGAGTIISIPGYLVKNNLQYEREFAARCSLFK